MAWAARPSLPARHRLSAEDTDAICDEIERLSGFVEPAIFVARHTAALSIGTFAFTAIPWDTEDIDTVNGHSTVTNPSRYVCQRAGYYALAGKVGWSASASTATRRASAWYKNGAALNATQVAWAPGNASDIEVPAASIVILLALNDYIELFAYQETPGALTLAAAVTIQPFISIHRISG